MTHLLRTINPHTQQQGWAGLPRPIAFVLSGGASLGAMQVGMLRALSEAGIEPDLVAGSSVGSLNGAVVADRPLAVAVEMLQEFG